jgi:peptide/nickel transport system substrate-binding protein
MFKRISILLALVMVASLLLVACGNGQEATPAGGEEGPGEPEEVAWDPYAGLTAQAAGTVGGWLDAVSMTLVSSDTAVTQIEAGAVDLYASNLSTPTEFEAIADAGLERSYQFGLFYEITYNISGPIFEGTGGFNPFSNQKIREATQWFYDRDYINQEVYGGTAVPKFFSFVSGFPDYARYVDLVRPLEAKYAFDREKAVGIIDEEMAAMGAVKDADGMWTYDDEPVTLIFLIRTDSDGTRVPVGDIISTWWEEIGFTVDRQYKTSSEASPLWVLGNPEDGLWHMYTGAWGSGAVTRDDGSDFQFYYSPNSSYSFSPLWQTYAPDDEYMECSEALANNTFATLDERKELFETCMPGTLELSYRVWLIDGKGASTWKPGVEVAYDLSAGVDINNLWPFTLRFTDEVGGTINWGTPDLFVDPANPVGGSNWTYDSQWQIPARSTDTLPNPHTGLSMPQRIESAEVTIQEGLPVGKTLDWVTLNFAPEIAVPEDAWIDWDPETETWIEAGAGVTAKRKVVITYPADLFDTVYWHDGSPFDTSDIIMLMIMTFAPGTEGSIIYDEAQVGTLESFKATFKGWKVASEDPLVMEYYQDSFYLDAEQNVTSFLATFWPEYGYGEAPWHTMAVANLAEQNEELAYTADKSDALEIEWMNFIGGPSLEILEKYMDQAMADGYIPFEATMGDFVTAEEAETRYKNLEAWYDSHGHFWVGTGPYYLDEVFLVEKTCTLRHFDYYPDPSDKWSGFAEPKLAEVEIDGESLVTVGDDASYTVYVDYGGAAYPADEIGEVKYLLFDASGEIVDVGTADFVAEGEYTFTISTAAAGAHKIEVAVLAIPVSIPSFSTFEFVAE